MEIIVKRVIKKIIIIVLIIVSIILIIYSPNIISKLIECEKIINRNVINEIGYDGWIGFYATVFGGIITLITFLITSYMSKKQIEEQHKENIKMLKAQNRNEELKELKNKVSDLLEAYSRSDKMRNIYNLIADEKYMEAFQIIEEIRNGIKLSKNNLYFFTDFKEINDFKKCGHCSKIKECKQIQEMRDKINDLIVQMDALYNPVLENLQNYINALRYDKSCNEELNRLNQIIKLERDKQKNLEENSPISNEFIYQKRRNIEIENEIKRYEEEKNNLEKVKIENNLEEKMRINDKSILEYNEKMGKIIEKYMAETKQYIILKKSIYDVEFKEQNK